MQKTTYLIHSIDDSFELRATDRNHQITIDQNHDKYDWISNNQGRLININDKGHMNSAKDYHGQYKNTTQSNESTRPSKIITLTKLDDLNIDDSLFVPMITGTVFDKFCTTEGGVLPGTNINVAGAPGVGKTTVLLDLLCRLHEKGKKVLFISAEMSQIDMARYLQRFPAWGQIPMLFLGDYCDHDPKGTIESVLSEGYDIVLTDSFTEVNDTVKEANMMTRGKTESWFLNLMSEHNKAQNKAGKYTTFLTILQLSKGGVFVGSNKLAHLASAVMYIKWDGDSNSAKRYMEFEKNRAGQVNKKLYYSLDNGVKFDEPRFQRDLFNDEVLEEERSQLNNESNAFDELFGIRLNSDNDEDLKKNTSSEDTLVSSL